MIGRRLGLSRSSAGLSLRELSDRIGNLVSAQAIGKYERNEMMPGSKVLIALAQALGVSVSYLISEGVINLEGVEFRKNGVTSKKEEAFIEAAVLSAVERYLEVENFVGAASLEWNQPQGFPFPVREMADAETAALHLRCLWNLGSDPIPNLVEFLEEKGIKVLALSFRENISGMMCKVHRREGSDVPVIILNKDDRGERQRFTLAHELAHLLLDVSEGIDEEKASHRFAGAFLIPADILRTEVGKHRHNISLGELFQLKAIYEVSVQAITYRCKDLGIIDNALYKRLFQVFTEQGWRNPPYEEPLPVEQVQPARFKRLCFRALAENVISEAKSAELLGISVRQLNREMDQPPEIRAA
jgi:Zn-dependent peptidase ImmA (M78 family)/DNA-binding XRE family transcriptional regulator